MKRRRPDIWLAFTFLLIPFWSHGQKNNTPVSDSVTGATINFSDLNQLTSEGNLNDHESVDVGDDDDEDESAQQAPVQSSKETITYSVADPLPQLIPVTSPPPVKNFDGINNFSKYNPPDTHGAVGINHVVSLANLSFEILDKNGNVISSPVYDSSFFSPLRSYGVPRRDGRIEFDPFGKRWIFIILYGPDENSLPLGFFIAISATSDPTKTWNMWAIPTSTIDYPTLGYNKTWICIGNNISSQLYVFNKSFMYSHNGNSSPKFVTISDVSGLWQPAETLDSAQKTLYLVADNQQDTTALSLGQLTGSAKAPVFSTLSQVSVTGYSWNSPADFSYPQLGGTVSIYCGSKDNIMNAVYINKYLWCVHAVKLHNPQRTASQWWQINPKKALVKQYGRIQDSTGILDYCSPSIAVDYHNNAVIGFSIFNAGAYIAAGYAVHRVNDPANSIENTYTYVSGLSTYANGKWGDYSHSVIDPVDHSLWTAQAYGGSNGDWASRWANLNLNMAPNEEKSEPAMDQVTLYPNPSGNNLTVQCGIHPDDWKLVICNSSGLYLYEIEIPKDETRTEINTSGFPAGIYFLRIESRMVNQILKFEVSH